jgi:C4-dicarboxylate transporter, DctM subunit
MNGSCDKTEQLQPVIDAACGCGKEDAARKGGILGNLIDTTSEICAKLSGILLLMMATVTTYEVIARYLGHPTSWAFEISESLMLWASFMALAFTFKEGGHIIVDIVFQRAGERARRICTAFNYIFMIGYVGVICVKGTILTWNSIVSGERIPSAFASPLWLTHAAIPVGCFFLLIQILRSIDTKIMKTSRDSVPWKNIKFSAVDRILMASAIVTASGFLSIVLFPGYFVGLRIMGAIMILIFPLMICGMPVSFVLGVLGMTGLSLIMGISHGLTQVPVVMWRVIAEYVLTSIPLFVLCSSLFLLADLGSDLFSIASLWVRHLKGGLGIAAICACAIFAAITGSSVACAATIGLIAVPSLVAANYKRSEALGTLAAGGTLGILIPPSVPLIVYGLLTTQSIGELFIAGVIPGTVLASMFALFIYAKHKFFLTTEVKMELPASWGERFQGFLTSIWGLLGPVIILGGLYTGIFTPTEAAGVAVFYGLFVAIVIRGCKKGIMHVLTETAKTTAMITFIIGGAMLVGQAITLLKVPDLFVQYITSASSILSNKYVTMAIINIVLLVLGCFLEPISIILITTPIFYPLIVSLGFDPVWFGVLLIVNMELGMVTPPVGMNLFVLMGLFGDRLEDIVKGVIPFIIIMIVFLVILTIWPEMALWLPNIMKK